jgi:hypothetical protein
LEEGFKDTTGSGFGGLANNEVSVQELTVRQETEIRHCIQKPTQLGYDGI